MEPKWHYNVHNSLPPVPILNQINPIITLNPTSLRYILILSSHIRLVFNSSLHFGLQTKILNAFLINCDIKRRYLYSSHCCREHPTYTHTHTATEQSSAAVYQRSHLNVNTGPLHFSNLFENTSSLYKAWSEARSVLNCSLFFFFGS
jgi:hypothetical protein